MYLACRINAENPEIGHAAYDLAYQWLALDQEKSAAAEAALSLYPEGDQSKLLKLYEDNASTLTPDPVYVKFYYSHPPASERLARMMA